MSLLESLGLFRKPPDMRPTSEIDGDILEELRAHIELRTQDNIEAGMSPDEAERDAEARFGDLEEVHQSCRKIRVGERIVLQRINLIMLAILVAAVIAVALKTWSSQRDNSEAMQEMSEQLGVLAKSLEEARSGGSVGPRGVVGAERQGQPEVSRREALRALDVEESPALPAGELSAAEWLERFNEAEGWRAGLALGYEIAELDPDRALEVLQAIYQRIPRIEHRQQLLKAFVFHGGHIHAVEILHLAATDPELAVQGWAFGYLKDYAFRDFTDDYAAYEAWWQRYGGQPLKVILRENSSAFVERLRLAHGEELAKLLRDFERLDLRAGDVAGVDLAQAMREAGVLELIGLWMFEQDVQRKSTGLGWLSSLDPGESWLRSAVLPLIQNPGDHERQIVDRACRVLGKTNSSWAVDSLLQLMRETPPASDSSYHAVSSALADLRDPSVIPTMIGMIVAEDTYKTRYGVGYFGLSELTGVPYDESHDAAWWLDWWGKNQERLPETLRGAAIPSITLEH